MSTQSASLRMYGSVQSELHDLTIQSRKLTRAIQTKQLELAELQRTQKEMTKSIAKFERENKPIPNG